MKLFFKSKKPLAANFLILLFCLVFVFSGFSQKNILLKGKITADSLVENSVNIVNLTQLSGTTNSETGDFEIVVQENDSLVFSSLQYELLQIRITSDILAEEFLEIKLKLKRNELEQVNISNINLTGNIEDDISEIPTYVASDFGLPMSKVPPPTPATRRLYTATSANVDLLLNAISGRLKRLKRAKENEDRELLVKKAKKFLPESVFLELKIPHAEVENFLFYCTEDPKFEPLIDKKVPLEQIDYYKTQVEDFLKLRKGNGSSELKN